LAVQIWPLSDVQAFMGHADISTTMVYVHHTPKVDAAAKGSAFREAQLSSVSATCPEPMHSDTTEANSAQLTAA